MDQRTYTITDLAREFDITPRSIRHYEDENLLSPERRGTHRVYHPGDRVRLQLILRGKRIGLSLAQIREILNLYTRPHGEEIQTQRLLEVLQQRRESLLQQQRDISFMLSELDEIEAKLR